MLMVGPKEDCNPTKSFRTYFAFVGDVICYLGMALWEKQPAEIQIGIMYHT